MRSSSRAWGVVLCIVACSKLAGIDQYEVAHHEPDAQSCGSFAWDESCGACMREHCCSEARACRSNSDCASFGDCLAACAPDASECRHRCFLEHPRTQAMGDYAACITEHCALACAACGDLRTARGPTCNDCIADYACDQAMACLNNPDCAGYAACTDRVCGDWVEDPGCRVQCAHQHPAASELRYGFIFAVTSCASQCAVGTQWQCIGPDGPNYPWFSDDGNPVEVQFRVVDPSLGGVAIPVAGVTVKVCDESGDPCGDAVNDHAPLDSAQTQSDGIATLSFSPAFAGQHFEVLDPRYSITQLVYPLIPLLPGSTGLTILSLTPAPLFGDAGAALASGGVVFAALADCAGSTFDGGQQVAIDSTEAALPDGGAQSWQIPVYGCNGLPIPCQPPAGSGPYAYFFDVPAGTHWIYELDPSGRLAAPGAKVQVRAGSVTSVYLNAPNIEL